MASAQQNESESYRVIVLDRRGTEVLLVSNGDRQILPVVEIPRRQRVAQNLTVAVKNELGEEVVCLFEPATKPLADGSFVGYQAAEHLRTCGSSKMPKRWVPLSNLRQDSFIEAHDYAAIKQVVTLCNEEIERPSAGPFARLGWFCELRTWIESVIEPMGLYLNGKFRQVNASASFSLVRFETEGPALWFKAVGEPNQREFTITDALARSFPDYLPKILASRPDWNGWLAWDIEGRLLSEFEDRATWEKAAGALARLQVQSVDRGSQILSSGAVDLRSAALSKLVEPLMGVVAKLMQCQTSIAPPILDHRELAAVSDSLHSSIDAMEATGIPDRLGHLDLNPANIIVLDTRCAFLDWAEAYVGNPLFSLEYLLQHARRAFGEDSEVRTKMIGAYCAQWGGVVSPAAIADALTFAPLLAVYAYAAGNETWRQTGSLPVAAAGYLRSLVRRMHREAHRLADRGVLCLQ